MKLRDFGENANRNWFQQILEWSRKKITIDDNLDCAVITAYITDQASGSEVGHSLGRTPRYVMEVAHFPNGTSGISFIKEPTHEKLFLKRKDAGTCTLLLF